MTARPAADRMPILGAIFAIALGGLFAGFGLWQLKTTWTFVRGSEAVIGRVVDPDIGTGDDTYRPLFSFVDLDGIERTAPSYLSASDYDFRTGEEVIILINPQVPDTVRVDGFWNLWLFGAIFTLLGLPFPVLGVWLIASRARPGRSGRGPDRADRPPPTVRRG